MARPRSRADARTKTFHLISGKTGGIFFLGGRGSGRHSTLGVFVDKCEDYGQTIDIGWLKRQGCLSLGRSGTITWSRGDDQKASIRYGFEASGIRLTYKSRSHGDAWTNVNELVPISYTATNFGGQRPWFVCPGCKRRCRILFGATLFRCRTCLDLKYECQYEPDYARAAFQSHKLRKRLGHSGPIDDPFPSKPKGMHWSTYERLMERDEELQLAWCRGISGWLDGFQKP